MRLDVLATEIVESLQPAAAERGVILQVRCPSPVVIQGDERWLRQLLFNLVDNGIKFSVRPAVPEPPLVGVDVTADEGAARVFISDSGPGIPEEVLDRIFERFYRADEARAYRGGGEGSGLGLSIAAWIAEAHGGRITARNRAEGRAVFLLTLPLSASDV